MRMSDDKNVSHWIEQVKDGDSVAAHQLWQHYYDRLVRMARQNLLGQNRGVSDEEDIVVSVFESFYRAAEKGRFPDLSGRDDLWRLLLKMSARKILDKRRHDRRQRRGAGAKVHSLDDGGGDEEAIIQVIGNEPTPEMVLMMTESFERLIAHLGVGQLREIAVGKMEGFSNADLGKRLQCSERTIERRLRLIREKCEQQLIDQNE
jgi:RNA polymerase sigma factor (sigma-70 family)